jgi:adenosylhomocysteine nucleosidase
MGVNDLTMKKKLSGIITALDVELSGIIEILEKKQCERIGSRDYFRGSIYGVETVAAASSIGKVAAASCCAVLLQHYHVDEIIALGTCGALAPQLRIGDIVLAKSLVQHDFDGRPVLKRFATPLLKKPFFEIDSNQLHRKATALSKIIEDRSIISDISPEKLTRFQISSPRLFNGVVATGDQVISTKEQKDTLLELIPDATCVDMEGGALAQVCHEYKKPLTVIRVVSDTATQSSLANFSLFTRDIWHPFSKEILRAIYNDG